MKAALGATGTAGRLAVQIAKRLGAGHVVAAGRGNSNLGGLGALGADTVVPMSDSEEDAKAIAQAACEVDIVLDYLWGSVTQAALPRILKKRADDGRALRWIEIGALAGDEVTFASVFLRKRNFYLLGNGQGSAKLTDMLNLVPDIARALSKKDLIVDTREAPLADVEKLWNAKLSPAQRLVFSRP